MNIIEKFKEEFGENLEDDYDKETFIAISANRWLGLVQLNKLHKLYSNFRRFLIQTMPKPDKEKVEIVKYETFFFSLDITRKITKLFFNNQAFEVAITSRNDVNVLVFKLGEHGIILAEMLDNYRKKFYINEINYVWKEIFSEITVQDDMVL